MWVRPDYYRRHMLVELLEMEKHSDYDIAFWLNVDDWQATHHELSSKYPDVRKRASFSLSILADIYAISLVNASLFIGWGMDRDLSGGWSGPSF